MTSSLRLLRQAPRLSNTLLSSAARSSRVSNRLLPRYSVASWQSSPTISRPIAAFSTAARRMESEGQVNLELSAKLESELSLEDEMHTEDLPEHLREYIDNTPFKLEDKVGSEEFSLTRDFGDEKIRVSFTISDLNNVDEPDTMSEAMEDELEDPSMASEGKAGGAGGQGSSAERVEDGPDDANQPTFPAHVNVLIERPSKGTLQFDCVAQDGLMAIDNVAYFKDSKLVEPQTVEAEHVARTLYTGAPFGNLDEDLQVLFEKYLDERGINTTMAMFIPDYIDYKEQKEYLNWLKNVKDFVD